MALLNLLFDLYPPDPRATFKLALGKVTDDEDITAFSVTFMEANIKIKFYVDPACLDKDGGLIEKILGPFLTAGVYIIDKVSGGKLLGKISNKVTEKVQAIIDGYKEKKDNKNRVFFKELKELNLSKTVDIGGINTTFEPKDPILGSCGTQLAIYGNINVS